ncbi:MAG: hypothetical protein ACLQMF_16850 [Rectinemataceae bacterium]
MDALNKEKRHELIRRVFPDLRYGGDPDIERYFELRRDRRLVDALAVYNGRLRVRYPDDSTRVVLLRLYREKDARYASYQESLILDLADKLALRIAANIDLLVAPLEKADLSNAFAALKAVESVLTRFGGDSEVALEQLARYEEFSRILEHRSTLSRRALELVREYDAVARADSPADYDFIARSEAIERRRRSTQGSGERSSTAPAREERYDFMALSREHDESRQTRERSRTKYFDPARIRFSAEDRERVEIPASLRRREDKVLVFCAKYWNRMRDPSFDRLAFLYSRKYGTNHYEIFRTIKLGRQRGSSDDEILSAVSGILTTSYDYSVSGDLYMQVMWRRLRSRMEAREIEHRLAAPGPESRVRAARAPDYAVRGTSAGAESIVAKREARGCEPVTANIRMSEPIPAPSQPPVRKNIPIPSTEPERRATFGKIDPESRIAAAVTARAAAGAGDTAAISPGMIAPPERGIASLARAKKASGSRLLVRPPSGPEPVPRIESRGGSISDRIRSLSGKAYDVYREIFLERVRSDIHHHLLANQTRSHGIFDTAANEAEDQIFGFMAAHYDDPFMDWEHSAGRDAVESFGFSVPSLDPIIEACFKRL